MVIECADIVFCMETLQLVSLFIGIIESKINDFYLLSVMSFHASSIKSWYKRIRWIMNKLMNYFHCYLGISIYIPWHTNHIIWENNSSIKHCFIGLVMILLCICISFVPQGVWDFMVSPLRAKFPYIPGGHDVGVAIDNCIWEKHNLKYFGTR